ncbi:ABC transporter permease [Maricaulis sp.]|jgi:putative ABC transport system permease protein|uniref:ABC transporter permease n=1 Tax=Maricaulis sp. TaxID=1486257 RepID=UPI0025E973A6|nr:ABC transporter permease [Maricaulis sp.]MDF1768588.1 ABC transporter permease [Maricaulis sp.]
MRAPLLTLAWKSLLNRGLSVGLTILAIVLSVTLYLGVEKIRSGVRDSFNSTISDTDLIVGARGGSLNLLLYSVFRLGDPTANMGWDSYELVASAPNVEWAVPISLGDSHRGYRVVGTTADYFQHYRYGRSRPLELATGRAFNGLHEVVLGAEVARLLAYQIGDEVVLSHGVGEVSFADHSGHDFAVVGVLAPTGTPVDRSLHVSLESIEAIHIGWDTGMATRADPGEDADALTPDSVTAVLVGVNSPIRVLGLQRQINTYGGEALTAIMPGVALSQLWEVIGAAETAFTAISLLVITVGLFGILTALTSGLNERRREMAVLRATGARPSDIFGLLVLEASSIAAAGAIIGIIITQVGFALVSGAVRSQYGLDLGGGFGLSEMSVLVAVTLAGALLGAWPAWRAQRNALADGLSIRL